MILKEEKQNLLQLIKKINMLDYIKKNQIVSEKLNDLVSDIENDFFTVVVLGEFKRGKSTLINALLGKEILPVNVLPETATINALTYSDELKVYVKMNDGTEREGESTPEYLQQFSAQSKCEDIHNIKYIKIGYPAEFLKDRLIIVDTPGVSDIDEQRVEVTYKFIPKAHTVLFLLDANSPLKKSEKDFIEQRLLPYGINNIIFVVNKYDNVDEEEEPNYLSDLRVRLEKAFDMDVKEKQIESFKLIPLSAKWALQGMVQKNNMMIEASGIKNLKSEILNIVYNGDVESKKIKNHKIRLRHILLEMYRNLEKEKAIKSADIEKLKETRNNLDSLLNQYQNDKYNIAKFVNEEKKNINAMIDKSLHNFYNKIEDDIVDNISFYKGIDFKEYVEKRVSKMLQKEMANWVAVYSPHIEQLLKILEKELAKGISYKFNQKVKLSAYGQGEIQQRNFLFDLTAPDVSDSTLKAGVISAGGAGLMMLLGGPVLMPFISMAAFPYLQRRFVEQKLAQAKDEIIPVVQEQLAKSIYDLKLAIGDYVDKRTAFIIANTENAYEKILSDLKKDIEMQIHEKNENNVELLKNVDEIMKNIVEIKTFIDCCDRS